MVLLHRLRPMFAVLGYLIAVTTAPVASAATGDSHPRADETATEEDPANDPEKFEATEEVASNSPEKKHVSAIDTNHSHRGQFNLRLALGGSYRIVMRYADSPPCSATLTDQGDPRTFCGFGAPMTLDTAIGFAPIAGVEPFLWGRFGLAKETVTNTTPLVILGAGARLYTMSDSAFKFFIEPAVGIELDRETSPKTNNVFTRQPAQHKQDFIVRLTIGPQYDFAKNFGAYLGAGLTVGMLRSLQTWMDLHVGVQARFP